MYILLCCVTYNSTVHWADLTCISLLIIFCIMEYVTNKHWISWIFNLIKYGMNDSIPLISSLTWALSSFWMDWKQPNGDVERRTDPPDAKATWESPCFLSLYIISHLWPQCVFNLLFFPLFSHLPFLFFVFPVLQISFQNTQIYLGFVCAANEISYFHIFNL